ncbi:PaaX family transcriptional regulator C-terminal domain-containing protein [Brevibacterium zhoupengii]|uniref:PaaX family transcriptional regulator n=1 Tax=Brevibacterium zhoupengii TaxID=2898795 RepID=UPI001E4CBFF4|nr:PaaX family transcriptional regulator C-terminal domain-containing protein [Brevibacterium zhoupengii]
MFGALSPIVDLDHTSGSPTSLLRTFVGLHLRDLGGWIRVAALLDLLATAGVSNSSTRSAVSRLKGKGLLLPDKRGAVAGYRLDPAAVSGLERGDRRIFSYRSQRDDEPWCLVSYSMPEVDRSKRVQLRRTLMGLGFGAVTDGLWIAPGHLRAEVEEALVNLDVRDRATIFITQTPLTAEPFAKVAAKWWELDTLAARHTEFIDRYEHAVHAENVVHAENAAPHTVGAEHAGSAPQSSLQPREAFALWLHCVDDWKAIPYVDPGLPPSALPSNWPGMRGVELFAQLRRTLAEPARTHVREINSAGS